MIASPVVARPLTGSGRRLAAALAVAFLVLVPLGERGHAAPAADKTFPGVVADNLKQALKDITAAGIPMENIRLFQSEPKFQQIAMPAPAQQVNYEVLFTIPEPLAAVADNALVGVIVVPPDGTRSGSDSGSDSGSSPPGGGFFMAVVGAMQVLVLILLGALYQKIKGR